MGVTQPNVIAIPHQNRRVVAFVYQGILSSRIEICHIGRLTATLSFSLITTRHRTNPPKKRYNLR
jgi:hypothetical protein